MVASIPQFHTYIRSRMVYSRNIYLMWGGYRNINAFVRTFLRILEGQALDLKTAEENQKILPKG